MEYFTVEKTNGILKFAAKWMDLGKTILSEENQTQKDKYNVY